MTNRFDLRAEREGDDARAEARTPPGRKTLTMQLAPAVQRHASAVGAAEPAEPCDDPQVASWPLVVDEGETRAVAARGVSGAGGALPYGDELRASFGRHASALDGVRVHDGAEAAGAARRIGADAYATGKDIALAAPPSRALIAHEAAHVVQQRSGIALSGGVGHAGDPYEQHADEVGAAFAAGRSVEALLDRFAGGAGGGAAVQRAPASGVASDSRDGDGAGADIRGHVTELQAAGNQAARIRIHAGAKQGVRREMSGYVTRDGVVHELVVVQVQPNDCYAQVFAPLGEVAGATSAVINPSGGVPQAKAARDLHTKVVNVMVRGDQTEVTVHAGSRRGVQPGMLVVLSGDDGRPWAHFTIEEVNETGAKGRVHHTQDAVNAHVHAVVNPANGSGAPTS
jgi:hypothetical protein